MKGFMSISEKGRIFAYSSEDGKFFYQSCPNHGEFSDPIMISEDDFERIIENPGNPLYNNSQ